MRQSFTAYHGTLASRAESIQASGIYPSDNPDDWLGEGTYFFVDGLDDPWVSASQWARCKAWDKEDLEFDEHDVAVIKVRVEVDEDRVFDLRDPANVRRFHRERRRWLKSLVPRRSTHKARPIGDSFDTELLNRFKSRHGIAVLIGEFHIQFSIRERHFRMDSRIPNSCVLCVSRDAPGVDLDIIEIRTVPATSFLESESE